MKCTNALVVALDVFRSSDQSAASRNRRLRRIRPRRFRIEDPMSWVGEYPCLEHDDRRRLEPGYQNTQVSPPRTYGKKGVACELLYLRS
jgi:hypothetical protein